MTEPLPPYKVYGLIDPRGRRIFYIGMSYIVLSRIIAHNTDKNGSAYDRCQEIIKAGYKPDYCIFGVFQDSSEAAFLEAALITAIPGLLNRTHQQERRDFWRPHTSAPCEELEELEAMGIMQLAQC